MAKKIAVKTILVCDDTSSTRILLKTFLTQNGFNVMEAENGEMAQELARQYIPDLIIMDIVMPGQNGITTIENLSAFPETADIPVIIITGKPSMEKLVNTENSRVSAIFKKPFPMNKLTEKVVEILND